MAALEGQITEYANIFQNKRTFRRERRNTHQDVMQRTARGNPNSVDRGRVDKEMLLQNDPFRLPAIGQFNRPTKNMPLLPAGELGGASPQPGK